MFEVSAERSCGCKYCGADWPRIPSASVAILEEEIDLRDRGAIKSRAAALGLEGDEIGWLWSLFGEPITYIRRADQSVFSDGAHRLHALRVAGVERIVVCTGDGTDG
jgi:hypothetical protein